MKPSPRNTRQAQSLTDLRYFTAVLLSLGLVTGCVSPQKSSTNASVAGMQASREAIGQQASQQAEPPKIRPVVFESTEEIPPVEHAELVAHTSEGMTLEALESLAMQHNPAIQQACAMVGQSAGIQRQVGLKPNPTIGYFGDEIGNADAAGLHGAFVSQTFVRGDKLKWNRAVVGQDVQRTRWLAEAQRYRVRNDVRTQFYEALGAQKRIQLAQQFRNAALEGVEIARARVEAQEAARADILQSEVQLSEVDLSIQRSEFEFMTAWDRLVAIAGMPELAPSPIIGDFSAKECDHDLETTYAHLVAASPVLAAACSQVQRARFNLQRQRVQPIPNLNAQFGTGYDDSTGDEFANVQLSIPLPVHNQNQGNIQAAYAEYCAATQNLRRMKMQLRRDLATALQACQIANATVSQYESIILPKVRETLELMQEAQRAGEFDFLRVLTARRAYFDANLKYVAALTDLSKANVAIDGLLLSGSLDQLGTPPADDSLRGSALSGR